MRTKIQLSPVISRWNVVKSLLCTQITQVVEVNDLLVYGPELEELRRISIWGIKKEGV